jgi:hypothetical protein
MTLNTPYTINLLLHFYCRPEPHESENGELFQETADRLQEAGVVNWDDSIKSYRTTRLGDAWVKLLCNTPMPRAAFLDQNGKEIV